jgi:hypothetical protein
LTKKQILKKTLKLSIILTILNVVFSVALSKVFSGNVESSQVTGYFGNTTLLEAGFMLLYGSVLDYTSTERWASTLKILKLSTGRNEAKEGEKTSFDKRAHMNLNSIKKIDSGKKRSVETGAIIYVLCGVILLAEIIILTLINV